MVEVSDTEAESVEYQEVLAAILVDKARDEQQEPDAARLLELELKALILCGAMQ